MTNNSSTAPEQVLPTKFTDIFKSVLVANPGICPECEGVGYGKNLTYYTEECVLAVQLCPLCRGTGIIQISYSPNEEMIKHQAFQAKYWYSRDDSHREVLGK